MSAFGSVDVVRPGADGRGGKAAGVVRKGRDSNRSCTCIVGAAAPNAWWRHASECHKRSGRIRPPDRGIRDRDVRTPSASRAPRTLDAREEAGRGRRRRPKSSLLKRIPLSAAALVGCSDGPVGDHGLLPDGNGGGQTGYLPACPGGFPPSPVGGRHYDGGMLGGIFGVQRAAERLPDFTHSA